MTFPISSFVRSSAITESFDITKQMLSNALASGSGKELFELLKHKQYKEASTSAFSTEMAQMYTNYIKTQIPELSDKVSSVSLSFREISPSDLPDPGNLMSTTILVHLLPKLPAAPLRELESVLTSYNLDPSLAGPLANLKANVLDYNFPEATENAIIKCLSNTYITFNLYLFCSINSVEDFTRLLYDDRYNQVAEVLFHEFTHMEESIKQLGALHVDDIVYPILLKQQRSKGDIYYIGLNTILAQVIDTKKTLTALNNALSNPDADRTQTFTDYLELPTEISARAMESATGLLNYLLENRSSDVLLVPVLKANTWEKFKHFYFTYIVSIISQLSKENIYKQYPKLAMFYLAYIDDMQNMQNRERKNDYLKKVWVNYNDLMDSNQSRVYESLKKAASDLSNTDMRHAVEAKLASIFSGHAVDNIVRGGNE